MTLKVRHSLRSRSRGERLRYAARLNALTLRWLRAAAVPLALAISACDGRESEQRTPADGGDSNGEALAAIPGFARRAAPYTVRALTSMGRAAGTVEIEGEPPADSLIQPTVDQLVCGAYTRRGIDRRGNRAVGVIVWIDGIRSGKPLPIERRFEVTNDRCALVPEVQAVIAGGTLNVRSLDAVVHRTRFTRKDTGERIATIRETDEGQVVPNEHVLADPGILELSCDVHGWTRAWIAAFDHPYFSMTGTDGSFVIDSVPPGRYAVHAWHPRLGSVQDSVMIAPGGEARITLRATANP